MSVKAFFFGYALISGDRKDLESVINICSENAIHFSGIALDDDSFTFRVDLAHHKKLLRLALNAKIELHLISLKGFPSLLWRHRRRAGVPIGIALALALFIFFSGRVWDIRIDGATKVSERELLKLLEDCGLCVGSKLDDIDCDVLANKALILSDEISWMSVNLNKNVAYVEIRELDVAPEGEGEPLYSNVVASRGGVIVGLENISGRPSVKIGDAVSRGQLLISGISGEDGKPLRIMQATGEVFAAVDERIEIRIPKKYTKKITKGAVGKEKSLIFFKNEIKFFSNSRNLPSTYDKIEVIENLYTKTDAKLPVAIKTVSIVEYESTEFTRTPNEMKEIALRELYRRIDEELSDAEILSRTTNIEMLEDECVLICNLSCVRNIAKIQEININ